MGPDFEVEAVAVTWLARPPMSVSIVDYGLGNVGSVANMFKRIGVDVRRVSTAEELLASERVLLPGVGAFDNGVAKLKESTLFEPLREFAATGKPLLGICLGMQLLFDSSEEGEERGLGLIPGRSAAILPSPGLRVPHMGWNTLEQLRDDVLLDNVDVLSRYYFVHSFHVVPERPEDTLSTTPYGENFVSMVRSGSIAGAQFHPEKSHVFGMNILKNFAVH